MSLPALAQDRSSYAAAAFLIRYREPTLSAYRADLRCFWQWCADQQIEPLSARRAHIELYLRALERKGYAAATIRRRLSTISGLFTFAVIDELIERNPTVSVQRPRIDWEAQRRTVLHPLEYAAILSAARAHSCRAHALVALLGMLGLRVSEACALRIDDLHDAAGYQVLHVLGKGHKTAEIPLPIPVLRAVQDVIVGRSAGPILATRTGRAMTRAGAARMLTALARRAGVTARVSPHALRRTFCTAGLLSGVPLRDMQYAMRHADARTTIRYDMSRSNLDRHAAHHVAAYLSSMAVG